MIRYGERITLALAWILLTVVFCPVARSQVAEISGHITEQSGGAVPAAEVKVVGINTQFTRITQTDSQGAYVLPNLPVGPYSLHVSASGFKEYAQSGIVLQVGNSVELNVRLEIGALSEKVEVTAGVNMVQTKDSTVAEVIDHQRIVDLPLNGRQVTQLMFVAGAAVTTPVGDILTTKNFFSSTVISVAGGQANGTGYLLDGGDNNDTMFNVNLPFPFPEALQEFSVDTNTLPARYGMHPGAVVNIVTKSGSNTWHGDLFEYLRNGDVNARNFFAPAHDSLKRNQYGGTLGGHIIKNKLFFFAGYQGTRNRQNPAANTSFVPTAAVLNGDFSVFDSSTCVAGGQGRTLIDSTNNQPFPGNQIPVSLFSAPAVKLATNYLPSSTDRCGKVQYGIPTTGDEDQIIGRIDWIQSAKHTFFGRYFVDDYRNPGTFDGKNMFLTNGTGLLQRAQAFTLGDTYTFNATAVNSARATFTRKRDNRSPAATVINSNTIGVNAFNYVPNFLSVTVGSLFSTGGGGNPAHFNTNTWQFADDVDLIRGRHQIGFGVDVLRSQNNIWGTYKADSTFSFNGQFTGDPMADFMLGDLSAFQASKPQDYAYRATILGTYIQDTFRVNSRITINGGIRWEPYIPPNALRGQGSVFDPAAFAAGQKSTVYTNAPAGSFYYGDKGVTSQSLTNGKWASFSPRLGFVISPHGDGRDSIRVGAAILLDSTMLFFAQRTASNPPFVDEIDLVSLAGGFANPWATYPGGNPFPAPNPPPTNVAFPVQSLYVGMPKNFIPTSVTQWNVSYQHQFGKDWLTSVTYLGNKTSHLWSSDEMNPAVYIPGTCNGSPCSTTANTNQRRLLYLENPTEGKYYAGVEQLNSGASANYNGLLLSVQHRFNKGFTLLSNYTWSRCISDFDSIGDPTGPNYEIPFNRRADRGDCAFDLRQNFNTTIVVASPVKGSTVVKHLLADWQFAPIIRAISGDPLTVYTGVDNSRTGMIMGLSPGISNDRPNQVLSNPYPANQSPASWINPAAFVANPVGTFGNMGRNELRGPGKLNFDVALSRLVRIREGAAFEIRAEAFNAINHTNFGDPVVTLNQATFGRILTAADPRILQFALKLHF
jgi:hypothetical protein